MDSEESRKRRKRFSLYQTRCVGRHTLPRLHTAKPLQPTARRALVCSVCSCICSTRGLSLRALRRGSGRGGGPIAVVSSVTMKAHPHLHVDPLQDSPPVHDPELGHVAVPSVLSSEMASGVRIMIDQRSDLQLQIHVAIDTKHELIRSHASTASTATWIRITTITPEGRTITAKRDVVHHRGTCARGRAGRQSDKAARLHECRHG